MCLWNSTNGKMINQWGAFVEYKFLDIILLHIFIELFYADFSKLVRMNYSKLSKVAFIILSPSTIWGYRGHPPRSYETM